MHTKTRPSEVIDWTKTGLVVLVCTSLWDLDWFQIATELYHVLKCVFPASRALCLLAVHYYFLIIIIIVVVYDYYYLSPLLAEDWHFEICLSLDAVAEKNKLLLLILFHKSFRFWNILPPQFPSFSFPYSCFCLSISEVDFGFVLFYFWWSGSGATCLESVSI